MGPSVTEEVFKPLFFFSHATSYERLAALLAQYADILPCPHRQTGTVRCIDRATVIVNYAD